MTEHPDLGLASRRVAACVVLVESVTLFARKGDIDSAYRNLQSLQEEYAKCGPLLATCNDRLAAESDGPVDPIEIGGSVHCWSSGHEAAADICRLALEWLFYPVVSDLAGADEKTGQIKLNQVSDPDEQWERAERVLADRLDWFRFDREWIAKLRERIRRERAKLVPDSPDDSDWLRKSKVAEKLGRSKTTVGRMVQRGELQTNGKEGRDCRIRLGSVIQYCEEKGIAYNDS